MDVSCSLQTLYAYPVRQAWQRSAYLHVLVADRYKFSVPDSYWQHCCIFLSIVGFHCWACGAEVLHFSSYKLHSQSHTVLERP
jgi:hypothetical protein